MSRSLRICWLTAHRWLGLTAGLLFVLLGLTGSLLVFDHAIDEWLNPDLLISRGDAPQAAIADIIAAAEDSRTGGTGSALSVTVPRVPNGVWTVWFAEGTDDAPLFAAVHVDPCGPRVTGSRIWGRDLMSWIYRLHFQLVAGTTGAVIVGVIGIVMLVSVVSGLLLWWPLWRHSWRSAFAIRQGRRFLWDVHKSVGAVTAVVLLVIAFTGVYMEFPSVFHDAVAPVSETTSSPDNLTSRSPESPQRISVDRALEIARASFPDARFDHLHPHDEHGVIEVAFRQPHEVQRSYGRTQVFLDGHTGEVLTVYSPDDFTAADAFFAWQFPLHNGEAFGLAGRWVVFASGLTPAVLYVTGVMLWWRRRTSGTRHNRSTRKEALLQPAPADTASASQPSPAANETDVPVTA